jgi:hypothetical protein
MSITVSGIAPGKWRYFTMQEIAAINELVVHSSKAADAEGMGE